LERHFEMVPIHTRQKPSQIQQKTLEHRPYGLCSSVILLTLNGFLPSETPITKLPITHPVILYYKRTRYIYNVNLQQRTR